MEIEVGKTYKNGRGQIIKIVKYDPTTKIFSSQEGYTYKHSGRRDAMCPFCSHLVSVINSHKTFSFDEFLEYGMNSDEAEIEEGKLVYFEFEYHSVFRENDDLYQILFDGVKHPITPMCMIGVIDGEIYIVA